MASESATTNSSSVIVELKSPTSAPSAERQRCGGFFLTQFALRAIATALTLIAVCVTVTTTQSVMLFGFKFVARYNYSSAFRFLVGANIVVCVFSALSLIFVHFLRRGFWRKNYFYLLLHDWVMTVLMVSGCAAASAVGYVGKYGEEKMGWQPVCDRVPKFCNHSLIARLLLLGFRRLFGSHRRDGAPADPPFSLAMNLRRQPGDDEQSCPDVCRSCLPHHFIWH